MHTIPHIAKKLNNENSLNKNPIKINDLLVAIYRRINTSFNQMCLFLGYDSFAVKIVE
jgi:hypothetical protein